MRLKPQHTWKSKPGYSICVLDRGVVRFDYPSHWVVKPEGGSLHLHDQEPCLESCDLGVSIFHISAEQLRGFPLDDTLRNSVRTEQKPYQESAIRHIDRPDMDIAWLEQRYMDAQYQRDARFRAAVARGPAFCLITMNYWADRATALEEVWDEVLRTLVMGIDVKDPTVGPVVQ